MTKKECIERLEFIRQNSTTYDYCVLEVVAIDWQKSGKNRTYFTIVEKSINKKVSKHYKKKTYGYLDNITGKYFPYKYGDLTNNFTFSGAKF